LDAVLTALLSVLLSVFERLSEVARGFPNDFVVIFRTRNPGPPLLVGSGIGSTLGMLGSTVAPPTPVVSRSTTFSSARCKVLIASGISSFLIWRTSNIWASLDVCMAILIRWRRSDRSFCASKVFCLECSWRSEGIIPVESLGISFSAKDGCSKSGPDNRGISSVGEAENGAGGKVGGSVSTPANWSAFDRGLEFMI
jgi:hypothetical protein